MVFRSRCYIIYDKYFRRTGRFVLKGYRLPRRDFFTADAPELARRLIGCILWKRENGGITAGEIVETEAYTEDDAASHSFPGLTGRNRPMFQSGGAAYVYLIYGVHHCFNVTAGKKGSGQAVLIRSLRPLKGLKTMRERRNRTKTGDLCSGPGKICQAFGIDLGHNGMDLLEGEIRILLPEEERSQEDVEATTRIGITKAAGLPRRYIRRHSPWLSGR
mgnify:CR=1 FL=1